MKRWILALLLVFVVIPHQTFGSEEDEIGAVMEAYWSAFARMDFVAAADFISAADLNELQRSVLPVFVEARESADAEVREMAAVFFAGVPEREHDKLSPMQVFAGAKRIMLAGQPQLVRLLASSSITIDEVEQTGNHAVVYHTLMMQVPGRTEAVAQPGTERLVKSEQGWRLRTPEDPAVTAAKFRQLFEGVAGAP